MSGERAAGFSVEPDERALGARGRDRQQLASGSPPKQRPGMSPGSPRLSSCSRSPAKETTRISSEGTATHPTICHALGVGREQRVRHRPLPVRSIPAGGQPACLTCVDLVQRHIAGSSLDAAKETTIG